MPSLLRSRKFWLTLAPVVSAAIMLARGDITAATFEAIFIVGATTLSASIAIEDHGTKSAGGPTDPPKEGGAS